MPTIQGTDGDTTGALITTATTATELTALIEAATHTTSGAMSTAEYDKLAAITQAQLDSLAALTTSQLDQLAAQIRADGIIIESYKTPVVDLMTTSTTDVIMPAVSGKYFHMLAARVEVFTRDAALVTGLTYDITQDGTSIIDAAQVVAAATINTLTAPATFASTARVAGIKEVVTDPHCHQFKITVPVAGVGLTDCTGSMIIYGWFDV
jgi:hypothetical protein